VAERKDRAERVEGRHGRDWERLETSRLKRLLTDVATVGAEPQGTFRLYAHDISEALDALDGRAGVTANDMAQMEFRFVGALDHSKHGIPNLERQIALETKRILRSPPEGIKSIGGDDIQEPLCRPAFEWS